VGIDLALETPVSASSHAWVLGSSRVEGSGTNRALFIGQFEVQTSFMVKAFGIHDTAAITEAKFSYKHATIFVDSAAVYVAVQKPTAYYLRFFKYDKTTMTLKYF
jgi:hypothetical protein